MMIVLRRRALTRTASAVLAEGGLAFTLINGGEAGVSMRGWRRLAGQAPDPASAPPWPAPQRDDVLRIEELELRVCDASPQGLSAKHQPPLFLNDCDGEDDGGDGGDGGDGDEIDAVGKVGKG